MKKIVKSFILLLCFIFFFIMFFTNKSFALERKVNSIDYSVLIKQNGDIEVTEVWDLGLENNDILVRCFDTNVEIMDLAIKEYDKDGIVVKEFENIEVCGEVKKDTYLLKDNVLNILLEKTERKYISITYILKNSLKEYLDCIEFDLLVFDKSYKFEIEEFTGRIKFEKTPNSFSDVYIWLHSVSDININKIDELKQINFSFVKGKVNGILKLKLVFPNELVESDNINSFSENRLETVIQEEGVKSEFVAKEINKNNEKNKFKIFFIIGSIFIFIACLTILIILLVHKKKSSDVMNNEK